VADCITQQMLTMKPALWKPLTGFNGLTENWKDDCRSGLLVSQLALPLSLAVAGASNFPPITGILTAIVGGVLVSFFTNSELTIKGPAAGLIVIAEGAVDRLGKGDILAGWHLALGAVVVAGVIQILMGILKLPRFADVVPESAVHGMLAAIGIMIMARQIHLVVGALPFELKGKEPLELIKLIPHSVMHMEHHIAIIGLTGLMIMFGWKYLSFSFFKKIPPALVVLIVSMLQAKFFHLFEPIYRDVAPLIDPGEFKLAFIADFGGITGDLTGTFVRYVAMFALIGSLESLLTVKAVDLLDPFKRKSDLSQDLKAVGIGNVVAGLLGGMPMISEPVRSAENVHNGAKTRWANLFHGIFLLVLAMAIFPFLKMIPVAALAAMLIFLGFRLASQVEFRQIYHVEKEQLIIFMVTVAASILTDLLVGIGLGILTSFVVQLFYGVKLSHIFNPGIRVHTEDNIYYVVVPRAAVFTNYFSLKLLLEKIPAGKIVQVDFSDSPYVDHTVMENVTRFKNSYESAGGHMELVGFENHYLLSDHPLAARKNQRVTVMS
jgi:MFS superfamily sulfate permease-like transporter